MLRQLTFALAPERRNNLDLNLHLDGFWGPDQPDPNLNSIVGRRISPGSTIHFRIATTPVSESLPNFQRDDSPNDGLSHPRDILDFSLLGIGPTPECFQSFAAAAVSTCNSDTANSSSVPELSYTNSPIISGFNQNSAGTDLKTSCSATPTCPETPSAGSVSTRDFKETELIHQEDEKISSCMVGGVTQSNTNLLPSDQHQSALTATSISKASPTLDQSKHQIAGNGGGILSSTVNDYPTSPEAIHKLECFLKDSQVYSEPGSGFQPSPSSSYVTTDAPDSPFTPVAAGEDDIISDEDIEICESYLKENENSFDYPPDSNNKFPTSEPNNINCNNNNRHKLGELAASLNTAVDGRLSTSSSTGSQVNFTEAGPSLGNISAGNQNTPTVSLSGRQIHYFTMLIIIY